MIKESDLKDGYYWCRIDKFTLFMMVYNSEEELFYEVGSSYGQKFSEIDGILTEVSEPAIGDNTSKANLTIPVVSEHRELLIAYELNKLKYVSKMYAQGMAEKTVDEYLSNL